MTSNTNVPPLLPFIDTAGGRGNSLLEQKKKKKNRQENAGTGASAATARGLSARLVAMYFRAPIKAFLKPRVDYMGYARAVNPTIVAGASLSWRTTSPALLASAIHHYGWSFLPNQVLPPLLANTVIGALLYTSYLQTLGLLHEPSARAVKRVDPLPSLAHTSAAGLVAGSIQSVVAAPLDALQARFQAKDLLQRKYKNMWSYAYWKTREIGLRGVFAGWSLSFLRDSFGNAVFFGVFEYIKGQGFYSFVSNVYGHCGNLTGIQRQRIVDQSSISTSPVIRPHYMIEPMFILLAGISASVAQAVIQYPISRVQEVHYGRLAWIDTHARHRAGELQPRALSLYASAYRKTFKQCLAIARRERGIPRWLYHGFLLRTLTQTPSTAAGLIVFEVIRRRYSSDQDAVKIHKDGYDILLV